MAKKTDDLKITDEQLQDLQGKIKIIQKPSKPKVYGIVMLGVLILSKEEIITENICLVKHFMPIQID